MATLAAMARTEIAADDPRAGDVQALLRRHLEFAHATTPPEGVHALDTGGLLDPAVTVFSLRRDRELIAIGALKELDPRHGEVKSMHTAAERGYERISLETGSMAAFGPARALYASAGFTLCGPFAAYQPSPTSTFMTLAVDRAAPAAAPSDAGPARPDPAALDPAAEHQQDQPGDGEHRPGPGP